MSNKGDLVNRRQRPAAHRACQPSKEFVGCECPLGFAPPGRRMDERSANRPGRRSAFTLIELLAALAVLSMLVLLLFNAFSTSSRMMALGSNQMENNQVVRAVLQQISRDVERTFYGTFATNMLQASLTPDYISGSGITNSTLYCLSVLAFEEGNTNGTYVNIGYQIAQVSQVNYGAPVTKWALQRGDDAAVDPIGHPTDWYLYLSPPGPYWKTLSDNIVGLAFQFYTNADDFVTSWPYPSIPNYQLPTSVGITIWAIDSDNYNRALALSSSLGPLAQGIFTNNLHKYTSRVFLPQSTQN